MSQEDLITLKAKLPPNWTKTIKSRTAKSKSLIQKVLAGKRVNIEILEAALNLAREHQTQLEAITQEIKSL